MRPQKKVTEEVKAGAPAFIVTFSDMITLLLTFFVMLLSMAKSQTDENKFLQGQNSFKDAVANMGLPGSLFSQSSNQDMEYAKVKYKVNQPKQEKSARTIDPQAEMLRRIVMDIEEMMKITPSQICGTSNMFTVTDIQFEPGSWTLNESAKQFITKYSQQVQEGFATQPVTLYVVGLAGSENTGQQQWTISARRAQAVADFLKKTFPKRTKWPVYSWGAGPGGDWTGATGVVSKKADIMIATLTGK